MSVVLEPEPVDAIGSRDRDAEVGRLFDPGPDTLYEPTNLEGLVQALDEALDLSALPETSRKCRAYAEQFGWEGQGARWEDLLYRVSRKARSAAFAMDGSE